MRCGYILAEKTGTIPANILQDAKDFATLYFMCIY